MEAAKKDEKENVSDEGKKGKGFWHSFYNFLAMGGFLVILVIVVGIIVVVSILFK